MRLIEALGVVMLRLDQPSDNKSVLRFQTSRRFLAR